jgi:hypothetical protein
MFSCIKPAIIQIVQLLRYFSLLLAYLRQLIHFITVTSH